MDTKQMVCLEYLRLCAIKLEKATSFEVRQVEARQRLHYLGLAVRYGVARRDMCEALRVTEPHLVQLLEMI